MKRQIKYRVLSVPGKVLLEVRLLFDSARERGSAFGEYTVNSNGDIYTTLSMYPLIVLTIVRQGEMNDEGQVTRAPYNPNDVLSMTRYTYPIFTIELERIYESMKVPELYSYVGKQLQLNDELAEKARRVFKIGSFVVEIVPITIVQEDDTKIEGIKLKFNNEQSSVMLTINDLESLLFTLKTMSIDSLIMGMHANYVRDRDNIPISTVRQFNPLAAEVDIVPKSDEP